MNLSTAINRLRRIKRQTICRMDQVATHTGMSRKEVLAAELACRRDIEAIDLAIRAMEIMPRDWQPVGNGYPDWSIAA